MEFLKPFYVKLGEAAADCFEFEKEFLTFTLW
jgi:hypothetical protein